jgi:hypothetical protein
VRAYLTETTGLAPATRKRKRAPGRLVLLDVNPMDRIDTVKVPKRLPGRAAAGDVAKVLAAICPRRPRKDLPLDRPGWSTAPKEYGFSPTRPHPRRSPRSSAPVSASWPGTHGRATGSPSPSSTGCAGTWRTFWRHASGAARTA